MRAGHSAKGADMMIKLSDGCYVAHDTIAEVTANYGARTITVRTKAGLGHSCPPGYGKSVSAAMDELVAKINAADVQRLPADDTEGGEI